MQLRVRTHKEKENEPRHKHANNQKVMVQQKRQAQQQRERECVRVLVKLEWLAVPMHCPANTNKNQRLNKQTKATSSTDICRQSKTEERYGGRQIKIERQKID